ELEVVFGDGKVVGSPDRKHTPHQKAGDHFFIIGAASHQATGKDELGSQVFHVIQTEVELNRGRIFDFLSRAKMLGAETDDDAVVFDQIHRRRAQERGD